MESDIVQNSYVNSEDFNTLLNKMSTCHAEETVFQPNDSVIKKKIRKCSLKLLKRRTKISSLLTTNIPPN